MKKLNYTSCEYYNRKACLLDKPYYYKVYFFHSIYCAEYKPNFQEVVRKTILKSKRRNKSAIS